MQATQRRRLVLSAFVLMIGLNVYAAGLSPVSVTLRPSQTQTFSAQGTNYKYSWSIYPIGMGQITTYSTTSAIYQAPTTITAPSSVTIYGSTPNQPSVSATINLIPNITVSVSPSWVQLTNGQSTTFTATTAGAPNSGVTWSVAVGTITPAGLYTVPSGLNTAQNITVKATSVLDPTKSATGTIALVPTISVSMSPTATTLVGGQSSTLNAVVVGTPNTGITWSMSPQVGTLANGIYTAPAVISSAQTVTITAASQAAPLRTASTVISLVPVSISLSPSTATLTSGQKVTLTATLNGTTNPTVNWSVSPAVGTVSSGVYSAPALVVSSQTVTVTAASAADPTKTASTQIKLVPSVSISVTPTSASLQGGQSTTLKATVTGTSNTAVNWSMSALVGTLASGVYTAPAVVGSAQTVTVTAASAADPKKTATAKISLVPVAISITPTSASLNGAQSTTLKATVTGTTNATVNWSMSPLAGTLASGVYTAPAVIASAETVTVTAASAADPTKTATAKISLVPVAISITPTSASLNGAQSTTLKATITGTTNATVNWSISPLAGTLASGVYTAPAVIASAETVTVTAASAADPTKTATAKISLVPVAISVTPTSVSLTGGQSTTLKATITGTTNATVNWSMSPSAGTLLNGVYTAPAIVASAQTITVTAASAADATKKATVQVSLSPVSVTLTPASASLSAGQSTTFTPTVSGSSNTTVNWTISPSVGTLLNGVYTAPSTITTAQTVTVTATSAADPSRSSSATISLLAAAPTVSISLTPSTASLTSGQSATFTPTVTGTTNQAVNWSLSPQIGTVTNGVYTAPAQVSLQQGVKVIAASAADPTKTASAVITLLPTIAVAINPTTASLSAGQTVQFSVSLSGTTNANVNWSMSPSVGTLANGLYTAPATISSQQLVTVTAASAADATKTASATITLTTAVGLVLAPSSIILSAGQSAPFNVTSGGTPTTAVTWTLTPAVGSITNGVYTAPVSITALQTIILTVASTANPAQTAQASIRLSTTPPAATISPGQATLNPSQTQQFTATSLGTNPTWSISPTLGSITSGGLYTAPATVASQAVVTVTATNATDSTQSASAVVTLNPAGSQSTPPPAAATLPLEVIGANGLTVSVPFNLNSGASLSGLNLWMRIHGLRYDTQASVQVNNSGWQPISNGTVTVQGLGAKYGGIGGGFHTLSMTMPIGAAWLQPGANTLTFRFNATDGRVSGFRVLAFDIQDSAGQSQMTATLPNDDPSTWQPPSTASSDILAGKDLWAHAALTVPTSGGAVPIQAHCSDCHADDGRDLKYFNYSNTSIRARSVFHGLSAQQGDQIASYIRSLTTPNPGRPWNPPYQPGPGMDSVPVANWSAGAGIDAVLAADADMLPYLLPGGSSAGWASNKQLNPREIPIALQLPDWNSWLPTISPMDAFGTAFTTSGCNTMYQYLKVELVPNDPITYQILLPNIRVFYEGCGQTYVLPLFKTTSWTSTLRQEVYSNALWAMVKTWELNQEFGLEGMPQAAFGAKANPRGWYANQPFSTSPNQLHIAPGPGLGNGTVGAKWYLSFIWYHTQLILNDGQGQEIGQSPIDFGYVDGAVVDVSVNNGNVPEAMIHLLWKIKALQEETLTGRGPELGSLGFSTGYVNPSSLVEAGWLVTWSATSNSERATLLQDLLTAWFNQIKLFTPQQYYQGKQASPTQDPQQISSQVTFGGEVWYMLPRFRNWGVSSTLVDQVSAWAATVWPLGNWAANNAATCTANNSNCTTN